MNRQLMSRQMFKMGGAAFPDLSGDGKVTQKDILIGRGVIEKQEGGMIPETPMMEETMVAAPEPPMMPQNSMMMPQQGQADPEVLGAMFDQLQGQVDNIEGSDDLEEMMNAVRGDVQPVEARRAELAEFVGPEDAQQTPDSVLALVQPVMQLASIDQGIGSLAADEMMDTPVEGPMAEGIMSTVNMAPDMPAEALMMEVGSQPPVNFNQGGAVQYFADENQQRVALTPEQILAFANLAPAPTTPDIEIPDLKSEFGDFQQVYRSILPSDDLNQQLLAQQKDQTKAQMLFDIANTALAFATPGSRQMSPAERLAEAARETQLFEKFGARSQKVTDLQREQALTTQKQKLALDTAALGAAVKSRGDLIDAQQALTLARAKEGPEKGVNMALPGDPQSVVNVPESAVRVFAEKGYVTAGDQSLKEKEGPELSDALQIVLDPQSQKAYAEGTMPEAQVNLFEAAFFEAYRPRSEYNEQGVLVKKVRTVPAGLRRIVEARQKLKDQDETIVMSDFSEIIEPKKEPSPIEKEFDQLSVIPPSALRNLSVEETAKYMEDRREGLMDLAQRIANSFEKGTVDIRTASKPAFNGLLFDLDGSVDDDSNAWRMIPTEIFNEKVTVGDFRGIGGLPDRFFANIAEVMREVGITDRVDADGLYKFQADKDIDSLMTQTTGVLQDTVIEDRSPSLVSKEIAEIRQGIDSNAFRYDASALASFDGIRKQLQILFANNAKLLPEYLGTVTKQVPQDQKVVTKIRRQQDRLKSIISEYVAFADNLRAYLDAPGQNTGSLKSTEEARRSLFEELQRQQGEAAQ